MMMGDEIRHKRLVVGLGNPGADYENTYHNAGALAAGAMAAKFSEGRSPRWETHKKLFLYTTVPGWTLVKPLTFMNVSGAAVREAVKKFGIKPEDLVLLHDDSDLPLGTIKTSRGHGSAGHHGVESVVAALGTNDFTRIRIGIRPKNERTRAKAETFVLRHITKSSFAILEKTFEEIAASLASAPME